MTELGVGSTLAGRYRLDALLGRGGMGSVWRAHHLTLNSPVAIKLIDPYIAATAEGPERFVREAQAAAALRSPHVVQILDYGIHEGIPYIAMEMLEGETLASRLARAGPLSPVAATRILTQIGRAVGKAHDMGIVHRDLKPDNVFVVSNDDEEVAKVLDFGIAKLTHGSVGSASQTRTGAVMGTPYYMSPEQAEGTRAVDHRADIWAMGVITYECLLGVRPFEGEAIGELILRICTRPIPVPSSLGPVPPGFDAWFSRACAREVDQRFSSVREMTDALRALMTDAGLEPLAFRESVDRVVPAPGAPIPTAGAFAGTNAGAKPRGTPMVLFLAGGLLALALGTLGLYFWVPSPGEAEAPVPSASAAVASQALAPEPMLAEPEPVRALPAPPPPKSASSDVPASPKPSARPAVPAAKPRPQAARPPAPRAAAPRPKPKANPSTTGDTDFGF